MGVENPCPASEDVIGKFTIAAGEMLGRARIAILADLRRFIRNFAMDHFSRD